MANFMVEVSLSENDRKLLIVLIVVLILFFILLGLLGMLIRYTMQQQGKRIDNVMHDPVVYRVIADPEHFRKYGNIQNRRILYHQALPAFIIFGVSMLLYIIYSSIKNAWAENYWSEFGTLFLRWDWSNPDNFATVWGLRILAKWPDVSYPPSPKAEYWIAYVLVPLWVTSATYFLVVIQAFFSRMITIDRRARSVYEKSLEGYNFYESMAQPVGTPAQNANAQAPVNPNPVPPNNTFPPRH